VPSAHGTGRLHQNIEPSELGRGVVDCSADTRGVREIGLERQRAPTERANLRRRRLGLGVPTAIDERHVGAPARKFEAHRTPDAAAAAGHEDLPVFEIGLAAHRLITAFPGRVRS
jgi:hypothetical protein